MATHTILPKDQGQSKKEFNKILNRPDETIVLILWDDETSKSASDLTKKITDANEGDMGFYSFVDFVVAPDPRSIIEELKKLENQSGADLAHLEDSVIVSISPFRNIVSEVVTKKRFNKGQGSVTTAIILALANG